ncbi:MAG: 50S ribosomal protein L1 [Phycisphaeraceae bacterium]|nr:50S ribosomal protein L1 [Phycisphaeraceae bacterium]
MPQHGRKYRADQELVDAEAAYELEEAITKLKSFRDRKFDQSVEIAMALGIDPKQAEQQIRGSIALPHGIGVSRSVIAFCDADKVDDAKAAGAIEAGGEELVEKIEGGWMDFDVAVAAPAMMRVVSKLGRVLGPKGLMPSPKAGTVTEDVVQAVKEYTAGKVEFRNDDGGNIHAVIGKKSFEPQQLIDNASAFIENIEKMRPSTTKGYYIKRVALSGSMTPSVQVAV